MALEAHTGRVRAPVSLPGYDPNWFAQASASATSKDYCRIPLSPAGPLSPGAYPRSYHKIITTRPPFRRPDPPELDLYCSGVYMVGTRLHCFVRSGHAI